MGKLYSSGENDTVSAKCDTSRPEETSDACKDAPRTDARASGMGEESAGSCEARPRTSTPTQQQARKWEARTAQAARCHASPAEIDPGCEARRRFCPRPKEDGVRRLQRRTGRRGNRTETQQPPCAPRHASRRRAPRPVVVGWTTHRNGKIAVSGEPRVSPTREAPCRDRAASRCTTKRRRRF